MLWDSSSVALCHSLASLLTEAEIAQIFEKRGFGSVGEVRSDYNQTVSLRTSEHLVPVFLLSIRNDVEQCENPKFLLIQIDITRIK
jgi:hypothetical protein